MLAGGVKVDPTFTTVLLLYHTAVLVPEFTVNGTGEPWQNELFVPVGAVKIGVGGVGLIVIVIGLLILVHPLTVAATYTVVVPTGVPAGVYVFVLAAMIVLKPASLYQFIVGVTVPLLATVTVNVCIISPWQ